MPARAVKDFLDGLRVLVPLGVLCLCGDLDLIGLMAEGAFKWDEEHRGLGITRKAWGLDSWPVQRMKEKFRFERDDIQLLMDELGFPPDEYWKTPSGSLFTREEAMLFYLRRMSYPNKLTNLVDEGFNAQIGALSELYTMVAKWMYVNHTKRPVRVTRCSLVTSSTLSSLSSSSALMLCD